MYRKLVVASALASSLALRAGAAAAQGLAAQVTVAGHGLQVP